VEAAQACGLGHGWLTGSSWNLTRAFHDARFELETITLDEVLDFRSCWHTCRCERFSSGRVLRDGGGNAIRPIDPNELPRPLSMMACSAGLLLAKRPEKYRQFEEALRNPSDLVAMDANHRLAALAARKRSGLPDLVTEAMVYVCR
jgi:hypothetical protein